MVKKLKKYLILYIKFRLQYFKAIMANRYDFFLFVFCDFVMQIIGITFYFVLFANIPDIKGWSFAQVLVIYGVSQLSYALYGLFFWGLYDFSGNLISGEFDGILIRPLSSLFQVMIKGIGDIGGVISGLGIIIYAFFQLHLSISIVDVLFLVFSLLNGVVLYACFFSIIAAASFWVDKSSDSLLGLFYTCINYGRYPINIYPAPIKIFLTWILPIGFTGFYPAEYFLKHEWNYYMVLMPIITLVFIGITAFLWSAGLRRYKDVGN